MRSWKLTFDATLQKILNRCFLKLSLGYIVNFVSESNLQMAGIIFPINYF